MTRDDILERITAFLAGIGIPVSIAEVEQGFLPGLKVEGGGLVYDPVRLEWPGDLLHEAGHVAVTAPADRATAAEVDPEPAQEMASLAWSYAAALAAGIDPEIVFHEGGYRGGGAQLAATFATGFGPGVPMLHYYRMTSAYPAMTHWLRPE